MTTTFQINLPVSSDPLGRWMEEHGAELSVHCMLGQWHVSVAWNKLHSYSDDRGTHRESWGVERHSADFAVAMRAALEEAMRQTGGAK